MGGTPLHPFLGQQGPLDVEALSVGGDQLGLFSGVWLCCLETVGPPWSCFPAWCSGTGQCLALPHPRATDPLTLRRLPCAPWVLGFSRRAFWPGLLPSIPQGVFPCAWPVFATKLIPHDFPQNAVGVSEVRELMSIFSKSLNSSSCLPQWPLMVSGTLFHGVDSKSLI